MPLVDPGTWIVLASAVVGLLAAFPLRTRLPAVLVVLILALCGAGLGWGGMLLRPDPSTGEFVAAVAVLAILVPAHVRIVLGRFGPRAEGDATPAARFDERTPPVAAP
jgi:hypothetical protein